MALSLEQRVKLIEDRLGYDWTIRLDMHQLKQSSEEYQKSIAQLIMQVSMLNIQLQITTKGLADLVQTTIGNRSEYLLGLKGVTEDIEKIQYCDIAAINDFLKEKTYNKF
jgi:spore germination protein YaaH